MKTRWPFHLPTPFYHIDGNYSLSFQAGTGPASITQTGLVPTGTQTLFFDANIQTLVPFEVSLGGQTIPFFEVTPELGYNLYGANVSAWAGDNEQLTFTALQGGFANSVILDDIAFSPNALIPEPDPLALMGAGGVLFALYRRFALKGR